MPKISSLVLNNNYLLKIDNGTPKKFKKMFDNYYKFIKK